MAHTILLPTDGSATAKAARRFAVDIARGEGDSVVVFSVAEPADYDGVEDETVTAAISSYLREAAEAEAAEIRAEGITATAEVVISPRVDEAIVERARSLGADTIVMGTHGRSGLARAVIGSVADRVIRHSHVPVVLVPLSGHQVKEP
jgi:nucleotide-binding universal stress UspA family protein